jgi:hypothetical protein
MEIERISNAPARMRGARHAVDWTGEVMMSLVPHALGVVSLVNSVVLETLVYRKDDSLPPGDHR